MGQSHTNDCYCERSAAQASNGLYTNWGGRPSLLSLHQRHSASNSASADTWSETSEHFGETSILARTVCPFREMAQIIDGLRTLSRLRQFLLLTLACLGAGCAPSCCGNLGRPCQSIAKFRTKRVFGDLHLTTAKTSSRPLKRSSKTIRFLYSNMFIIPGVSNKPLKCGSRERVKGTKVRGRMRCGVSKVGLPVGVKRGRRMRCCRNMKCCKVKCFAQRYDMMMY